MKFYLIAKLPDEMVGNLMKQTNSTVEEIEEALKSKIHPTCAVMPSPDSTFSIVACLDDAKALSIGDIALPKESVDLTDMLGLDTHKEMGKA